MSSATQQYLTPNDLNMLRRVLDDSGLYDGLDDAAHLARLTASRLLIGCFQQGISMEMERRLELFNHLYQDMSERVRAEELAGVQMWKNEAGALASPSPAFGVKAPNFGPRSRSCPMPRLLRRLSTHAGMGKGKADMSGRENRDRTPSGNFAIEASLS